MPLIPLPKYFNKKAELYKQLGQLFSNGVPPAKAFRSLAGLGFSASQRNSFNLKADRIESGQSLGEAFFAGSYPPRESLDASLIETGEKSGRLVESLDFLDRYYRSVAKIYASIIRRLTIPILVIHVASLVLGIATWFLSQFDFSLAIQRVLFVVVPLWSGILLLLFITFKNKFPVLRSLFEKAFSFVPILSKALRTLFITRFTLALDSSLNAGVAVTDALVLSAKTSGSVSLMRRISKAVIRLEAGEHIAEALKTCKFFPESYIVSLSVAEQSGKLDETLDRLYNQYVEESEIKLQQFGSALTNTLYACYFIFMVYAIFSMLSAYLGQLNDIL